MEEHGVREEAKYVQQHLANERTYLAWIRTCVAIIGLGFLSAGIAFQSDMLGRLARNAATVGGLGAVLMGSLMIVFATRDYFRKRASINSESFRSTRLLIWFVCLSLAVICALLVVLVLLMLL